MYARYHSELAGKEFWLLTGRSALPQRHGHPSDELGGTAEAIVVASLV